MQNNSKCSERCIVISEVDSSIAGFRNSSVVNIVKIEKEIQDIEKLVLSYKAEKLLSNTELLSSMHLYEHEILDSIQGRYIGVGSKLQVGSEGRPMKLTIAYSEPGLKSGQIGRIGGESIILRPHQSFRELNLVLCISKGKNMSKKEIPFKSHRSTIHELKDLVEIVPEVGTFLNGLTTTLTRAEVSVLASLLIINTLMHNRTEGRLGLVTFAETPDKFSVQYGSEVRPSIEFLGDLQSEEVLVSLIFSILDNSREIGGYEKMQGAYRSIAEYLEDFGSSRPTLLLVFSGDIGSYDEENLPFTKAIKNNERYQIEFFTFEEKAKQKGALRLLKGIKARVLPVEAFSSHIFLGHIMDVIDNLVPSSASSQSDA